MIPTEGAMGIITPVVLFALCRKRVGYANLRSRNG